MQEEILNEINQLISSVVLETENSNSLKEKVYKMKQKISMIHDTKVKQVLKEQFEDLFQTYLESKNEIFDNSQYCINPLTKTVYKYVDQLDLTSYYADRK